LSTRYLGIATAHHLERTPSLHPEQHAEEAADQKCAESRENEGADFPVGIGNGEDIISHLAQRHHDPVHRLSVSGKNYHKRVAYYEADQKAEHVRKSGSGHFSSLNLSVDWLNRIHHRDTEHTERNFFFGKSGDADLPKEHLSCPKTLGSDACFLRWSNVQCITWSPFL